MNDQEQMNQDSVSGIVDSIIFQNDENGYTVCEIEDTHGEPVVITGIIPYLAEGDKITAYGKWTNHQVYGRQFKAETYEKNLPAEQGDILRYLASGAVKGVGPKTAQKIVEQFGTDTFSVIENNPDWLTDIPGITPKRAAKISENFKAISGARSVMMFCRDFFTPQTAMKIYKKWGGAAIDRIRNNPYRLCEDFWGISFSRADQIAMSTGLSLDSEERIIHGAVYVLRAEAQRSGHTCLPYTELCRCTLDLLFSGDTAYEGRVAECIEAAIAKLSLVSVNRGGTRMIFESRMYNAEVYIAKKLKRLSSMCPSISAKDSVLMIEKSEAQSGIEYAAAQKEALLRAMSDGVMILTGGPGTGKTTIIKGLISIFSSLDFEVSLAAPTGRAAKRMSEATSHEAKTIHRLLEMDAADESSTKFMRDENNTLESDVLIIDEASMIDVLLMEAMLRAMKNGSRLILIGDSDQLPSVGAGNVLGDIIASEAFNVVRLTEIFRQSGESLIITNAHRINEGSIPIIDKKDADFFYLPRESEEIISQTVVDLVRTRLPRSYGEDIIAKIQVLTPSRKGLSGTDTLNASLQAALNPPSHSKNERKSRDVVFRVGDRVMQTKNNYTIEWETDDGRSGMGIYNGDVGIIEDIDSEENLMTVLFDERRCVLDFTQLDELDHAYAITVHKSQGSEYPVVIIPLYSCAPMLLTRNLLYTAVTRGAKMVILVGRCDILEQMVSNDRRTLRCTMLCDFIKSEN
ncbi:MAG: ATP-dependent RecD-like DNA helicase [Ruminococcaceae bacterium]|nr:ATP-dependent RecD-like DNA helicase [Oscillospiraceae bacterium]